MSLLMIFLTMLYFVRGVGMIQGQSISSQQLFQRFTGPETKKAYIYIHECLNCLSEREKNNPTGCDIHKFRPEFWRRGDTTKDELVFNTLKKCDNDGKHCFKC
jgi:mannitol/fructose-specific phosphotransferase system IIA component (Ntr-type)